MLNAESGQRKTESGRGRANAAPIMPAEPSASPKSARAEIVETPPASFAEPLNSIEVAGSDMLSLSQRSGERLMRLMESAVSDRDLERQSDGGGGVPLHNIETAISCANALANLMQVNVNLLKAIKK